MSFKFLSYVKCFSIILAPAIYENNIIHTWNHDFSIASTPYYDENFLYRPCKIDSIIIDLPGAGGKIEKYNTQGELIWEYTLSSNFIHWLTKPNVHY